MKNEFKLFIITVASLLFALVIMSIFYWLTYMDIQNNPTQLFHIITLTKEDKTIILVALNIVYTLMLFVYSFINLYISFYKGDKNHVY
jgi:hypothetical protein